MAQLTWQREVPATMRRLDTLPDPDYADLFTTVADRAPQGPALRWLRELVGTAPLQVRVVLGVAVLVQRTVLGLRPARTADSRRGLLGWRVTGHGDDWVRLEASSSLMTGHLVYHLEGRRISFATFVRYDRRVAAYVWPPVSRVHRLVGLYLLRYARTAA